MERQLHGFLFEKYIIEHYNYIPTNKYTSQFDAYTSDGVPVQIKATKTKNPSLAMGDIRRYIKLNEDFILIVGHLDNKNNIKSISSYYVDIDKLHKVFIKNNVFERVDYVQYCLDSVSNDKEDDIKWKSLYKQEQLQRKHSIISINGKRDHHNQKRIQWGVSFKNYDAFINSVIK